MLTYLGIGSNLGEPLQHIQAALIALAKIPNTQLLRRSPWYGSKAIGPGEQADYLNGVIELETTMSANQLLHQLQSIETQQGRKREIRWGARTLDLDILLYGHQCFTSAELSIPHPRICERAFVLAPLATLNPNLQLPDPNGKKNATIATLLNRLPADILQSVWLLEGELDAVSL